MVEKTHRQHVGRWGEDIAVRYLEARQLKLVERNAHTPYGEIDLVMMDGEDIVFVEVKTRTTAAFGLPEEAITVRKREHMIHSAEAYLQERNTLPDTWRIDVVAIRGKPSQADPEIEWFQNAVV